MIPIKTSIDDIQKVLSFLGRQVGWTEPARVERALGSQDDRKIGAMVEFGLVTRDNGNLKITELGKEFNTDQPAALRKVLTGVELYRSTLEWVHYGKSELTAAEIGQYWEASHAEAVGNVSGTTLKDGAVCFGRMVDGAGIGTFTLGRAGKETRVSFRPAEVDALVNGVDTVVDDGAPSDAPEPDGGSSVEPNQGAGETPVPPAGATPTPPPVVTVAASPSVHVNVEIHIAADATADTVREIFKNMARYVLDKPVTDDVE